MSNKSLPKNTPFKLSLNGETFTYKGILGMLATVAIFGGLTTWMMLQFMPPELLNRINARTNNIEIRLKKIEQQKRL